MKRMDWDRLRDGGESDGVLEAEDEAGARPRCPSCGDDPEGCAACHEER